MTAYPFAPISTNPPPHYIPSTDHPLKPPSVNSDGSPIPTNKFYTNMLLDNQQLPAWTHPYSVWMARLPQFFGLAISQTRADQRVFGPDPNANPAQYYLNPAGIHSAVFSAKEFSDSSINLSLSDMGHMSTTVSIGNDAGRVVSPLVPGMGLVTATYHGNITPVIQSQVGFRNVIASPSPGNNIGKYVLELFDNTRWVMYIIVPDNQTLTFATNGVEQFIADRPLDGVTIQIGSCPNEADYDPCAGAWAASASVQAQVNGDTGNYSIKYEVAGSSPSGNLVMYALPHHVAAFTGDMQSKVRGSRLDSTTMGTMTCVNATQLDMAEELPTHVGFFPWAQFSDTTDDTFTGGKVDQVMDQLRAIASKEASQDLMAQCSLDSMYFSGKGIDKFANLLFTIKYIIKDDNLARDLLKKLQDCFAVFAENRQQNPLTYENTWKGLVSTAGLKGDPNADFGNSYYNDHHFHFGYFVHAAAIIAKVDRDFGGCWLNDNREYVNALVRDYANPSAEDKYFPQFRSFDFWGGHCWAKGLFISGDGKDEESSSEDYHSIYGMKLWGIVSNDEPMVARADLMLAIERRAMNMYMLYANDNTVAPAQILRNRVSGIMFENKVDHATYFGMNTEYIQGIHMIPVTPISSFVRGPTFVQQEWDDKLKDLVGTLDSGWRGILESNHALFDPNASMEFFKRDDFQDQWLDGGMSRTFYLAFAASIA